MRNAPSGPNEQGENDERVDGRVLRAELRRRFESAGHELQAAELAAAELRQKLQIGGAMMVLDELRTGDTFESPSTNEREPVGAATS
jgi:hypothetical protein